MRLKNLSKVILVGSSILMVVQVCGIYKTGDLYKMNVVYAAESTPIQNANFDQYKEKCIQISNDFFDENRKDIVMELKVTTKKEINAIIKEVNELAEKDGVTKGSKLEEVDYDEITCFVSDHELKEPDDMPEYFLTFNGNTKELVSISLPGTSAETEKMIQDGTAKKVTVPAEQKEKYKKLIEKYHIGGIIQVGKYEVDNNHVMPVLIYRDKDNTNKRVTIIIDPATGGIYSLGSRD